MRLVVLGLMLLFTGSVLAASDYLKKGDKAKAPAVKGESRAAIKGEGKGAGIIGPSDSKSARGIRSTPISCCSSPARLLGERSRAR